MVRIPVAAFLSLTLCTLLAPRADAQPPRAGIDPAEVSRWDLETITLKKDGRKLSGLIRWEDRKQIEFVEVRRSAGEPMGRFVRVIGRERIANIERLDERERIRLSLRLRKFLQRTEILEGLLEDVELTESEFQEKSCLKYEGPWFTLRSRADEATTRLAIVRLEQVFAGFRTYLSPRSSRTRSQETLRIVILGSAPEYQQLLDERKSDIRQTAFFDTGRNEIIAGGQLASIASELDEIRVHHAKLTKELRQNREVAEKQTLALRAALRQSGNSQKKISLVVRAARVQWKKLRVQLKRQIDLASRRNDALYHEAFRRLYHEAFHAYLSNFVMEDGVTTVPRWLNEGWAQVFEAGLLEAGTLRVDAPSPERMQRLQNELRSEHSLSLKDVLTVPVNRFVVGHGRAADGPTTQESSRLYLYSWGLAYYLTFHRHLLGSSAMDEYLKVTEADSAKSDVARFEKLVGSPLEEFEAQWRKVMLSEKRRGG